LRHLCLSHPTVSAIFPEVPSMIRPRRRSFLAKAIFFTPLVLVPILSALTPCHARSSTYRVHRKGQITSQRRQIAAQAEALTLQASEIRVLQRQVAALSAQVVALRENTRTASTRREPVVLIPRGINLGTPPYDLILNGSYPGAIGAAEDRLKLNPSNAEALALQAYAMIKINQVGQAGPLIARAAALNPTNPHAKALVLVAQGALADAQGNTDAAGKAYFAADHINNTLGLVYLAAADHFVKIGKPDKAKMLIVGNGANKGGLDLVKTNAEKDALQQKASSL
jgi:hypothetical protein